MLDLAFGLTNTSRLCCQLKVTPDLEGVVFTVPQQA
jgi:ferredoxin